MCSGGCVCKLRRNVKQKNDKRETRAALPFGLHIQRKRRKEDNDAMRRKEESEEKKTERGESFRGSTREYF